MVGNRNALGRFLFFSEKKWKDFMTKKDLYNRLATADTIAEREGQSTVSSRILSSDEFMKVHHRLDPDRHLKRSDAWKSRLDSLRVAELERVVEIAFEKTDTNPSFRGSSGPPAQPTFSLHIPPQQKKEGNLTPQAPRSVVSTASASSSRHNVVDVVSGQQEAGGHPQQYCVQNVVTCSPNVEHGDEEFVEEEEDEDEDVEVSCAPSFLEEEDDCVSSVFTELSSCVTTNSSLALALQKKYERDIKKLNRQALPKEQYKAMVHLLRAKYWQELYMRKQ